jgi:hypothetical protein
MKPFRCELCRNAGRLHPDHWLCLSCFQFMFPYSPGNDSAIVVRTLEFFSAFLVGDWGSERRAMRLRRLDNRRRKPRGQFLNFYIWRSRTCPVCGGGGNPHRTNKWMCHACALVLRAARDVAKTMHLRLSDEVPVALLAARAAHLKLGRLIRKNA